MRGELILFLALGLVYLLLFGLCEWLFHRKKVEAENTRKIAHAGSGILALSFPFLFDHTVYVMGLCAVFLLILVITKNTGLMRSIHAIPRVSYGSTMFPIVVAICFWFYSQTQDLSRFYIPVLVMALADPVACLVGKRIPLKRLYRQKSLGGSLAFWGVAFGVSASLMIWLNPDVPLVTILGRSAILALATTTAEAISLKGMDNLTIPLSAMAVLAIW